MVDVDPAQVIEGRWRQLGGESGPFGRRVGLLRDVDGGQVQTFENGEIGWSPTQEMVVGCYRLRSDVCFEWTLAAGSELHYDYFRYDVS